MKKLVVIFALLLGAKGTHAQHFTAKTEAVLHLAADRNNLSQADISRLRSAAVFIATTGELPAIACPDYELSEAELPLLAAVLDVANIVAFKPGSPREKDL